MKRTIRGSRWLTVWCMPIGAAMAVSAFILVASADDAKSPPAGQRVFYTGHSFHMFVPPRVEQLVKSAGIEGHKLAGMQGIGGSRVIQHWDLEDAKNKAKPALERGDVDVFTMAAHLQVPDPGIDHFTELGLKHNPQLRLLVQASWMPFDQVADSRRIRDNSERDETRLDELQAATTAWRKKLEAQADELNKRHNRRAVFIVPVGDAVVKLREQIAAGEFPGVKKQADLFRDSIGHGLGHVQALAAYSNFAAIYHRSPEGLKLNEQGVEDAQHAILQRIAWGTVSRYAYSGVEKK
jgi:hypothetical protein